MQSIGTFDSQNSSLGKQPAFSVLVFSQASKIIGLRYPGIPGFSSSAMQATFFSVSVFFFQFWSHSLDSVALRDRAGLQCLEFIQGLNKIVQGALRLFLSESAAV